MARPRRLLAAVRKERAVIDDGRLFQWLGDAMFLPDKSKAFREARRVLAPHGAFLFSVWDRIEANDYAMAVTEGVTKIFPDDPPNFFARAPHGYHR